MIPTLPFLFGAMFTFPKFMGGKIGIDLPHMISYHGYKFNNFQLFMSLYQS